MIRDIALGQFFPGDSFLHKLDPRVKIMLTLMQIVLVFLSQNFLSLAVISLQVILIIMFSGISFKIYFKSLKAVLFLILFATFFHVFNSPGEPIFSFGFIKITREGINGNIFTTVLIISLLIISSSLSFTTSPTDLTDALERLMRPLKIIKVPVHEIAMIMTIALRFIPTLLEETDKIIMAQKSRGADFESGKLAKRVRALAPILVPLFASSIRRAIDLAIAMECRCYKGGEGRTRMKVLHIRSRDIFAILIVITFYICVVYLNLSFPAVQR